MRLEAFRVTNYKTVLDSGRVEINPNVTCLLGKNEAGKVSDHAGVLEVQQRVRCKL
jgi:hypothetical protein